MEEENHLPSYLDHKGDVSSLEGINISGCYCPNGLTSCCFKYRQVYCTYHQTWLAWKTRLEIRLIGRNQAWSKGWCELTRLWPSWWFQPIWNMSQNGNLPQSIMGENKKHWAMISVTPFWFQSKFMLFCVKWDKQGPKPAKLSHGSWPFSIYRRSER